MPTALPTMPTEAQFSGKQIANICGGQIMLVQTDKEGGRWRSLEIKGCEGQLIFTTAILEMLQEMRTDSILDISQNHCAMLDWRLILAQLAPILSRLGKAVLVRVGLSTSQKALFEGRM
jgi:hypothetical protein